MKRNLAMGRRPKFDTRRLMELAVEVMRASVAERRSDGKASPRVGAVLWRPDGTVQSAHRGELREGDHAEYTLLERKNRDQRLDGGILFATLEPCARGARKEPKLSCAERVALARIKEVWVGIEDPDPTVDRKGIKYLQDAGIVVRMFDRDLQETIRRENKAFIEQALERAAAARVTKRPAELVLSILERQVEGSPDADFSREAIRRYREALGVSDGHGASFHQRLQRQGLLIGSERGTLKPTGFGLLMFGERPRESMPHAGMLGTIRYADGREEIRDFDGPMVLIPEQIETWLRDKLPNTLVRSQMRKTLNLDVPFELVREGVVNALVHRDYQITGAKCQIVVTTDTITIRSPGRPIDPITLEQLQTFTAPMLSRNPQLHYVFAQLDLAEERGLGMSTFGSVGTTLGLPRPTFRFDDPYLALTIYRTPQSTARTLPAAIVDKLGDEELAGLNFLSTRLRTTQRDYSEHFKFDARKAQRHLARLVQLGLVRRSGKGPSTGYSIVQ